jgi:hypothetical protein
MAERQLPVSVALTSACRRKLIVVLHQIFAAVFCFAVDIGSQWLAESCYIRQHDKTIYLR